MNRSRIVDIALRRMLCYPLPARILMSDLFGIELKAINGTMKTMADYQGKVLLIVNVASKCGFTPQYEGLEKLHRQYSDKGLVILGFPCDQFAHQEPGNEAEIMNFCSLTYNVTFPMFAKIKVNGSETHALYQNLKSASPGVLGTEAIKWNFTKFLVDRNGKVTRYAPGDTPASLEEAIRAALG